MGENMAVKITRSSEFDSEIIINDSIKVTINAQNFKNNGEMDVEFDDTKLTEAEASTIVESYFSKVLEIIELKNKHDKVMELKSKIGEIE
jgi:hypothetical protein